MAKKAEPQQDYKIVAKELIDRVQARDGAWDQDYRAALAKHFFCQWMGEDRDVMLATQVGTELCKEFDIPYDEIGYHWWEAASDERTSELIAAQGTLVSEIDEAKSKLEGLQESVKSAKAQIDEGHTRLRTLARELEKPYSYPLPPVPNRQRELPLADGEEWRTVPLADVLADDIALKSVVINKLGNITLGEYCKAAEEYGAGDTTKKLTRKQWDRVEEIVQDWHTSQAETQSGDQDNSDQDEGEDAT